MHTSLHVHFESAMQEQCIEGWPRLLRHCTCAAVCKIIMKWKSDANSKFERHVKSLA